MNYATGEPVEEGDECLCSGSPCTIVMDKGELKVDFNGDRNLNSYIVSHYTTDHFKDIYELVSKKKPSDYQYIGW